VLTCLLYYLRASIQAKSSVQRRNDFAAHLLT